ncbi:MAG: alpha-galactosidase [Clostridia bacterium]|nr:alpha-galactosidase [Clostridia bacterium]
MNVYGVNYSFSNLPSGYQASLTGISDDNKVILVSVHITPNSEELPQPVTLSFHTPAVNVLTAFEPVIGQYRLTRSVRPGWNPVKFHSRLSGGYPLLQLIGHDENNALTFSVADVKTPITVSCGILEDTAEVEINVTFFSMSPGLLSAYETQIRLDFRPLPYGEALQDAEAYLLNVNGLIPCHIPDNAKLPMYSSWYAFHQQIHTDELLRECEIAKGMGMDTILIDDGWQTEDNGKGYAYCGVWEVYTKKINNVRDLVSGIHGKGMKVVFWFSVPFVGKHSKAWTRFEGMLLNYSEDVKMIDPRYPEARTFLIEKYVEAVRDWGLDGLKLDFIDCFRLTEKDKISYPKMDSVNLFDGVEKLLTSTRDALQKINPEVLLEFRQAYVGPYMQTCGNMFRVGDCPDDALTNRIASTDMRLTMKNAAIHSDMLMWHKTEPVEMAARQLLNAFFAVPQISVRLSDLSGQHEKMLRYYLSLWRKTENLLSSGTFSAEGVDGSYTCASAENDTEIFTVGYGKNLLILKEGKKATWVNSTKDSYLYVDISRETRVSVFDCMGNLTEDSRLPGGIHKITVPLSGLAEFA